MDDLKFDEHGLMPAIVQDRLSGEVRMCAYVNREAIAKTLETGRATFFSRSRSKLWEKGESSGHTIQVRELFVDCDADTLLMVADPVGPSCHTGQPSCFFRRLDKSGVRDEAVPALTVLARLEGDIAARKESTSAKSYTKSLLDAGVGRIGDKVREEADEFARALSDESDDRVVNEAADVVYHLLVGLAARGKALRDVIDVLARRSGTSGHAEKASRFP
ncbi:MAG TPA: bifunctional phosphoribosyl-AMP cyclohydrolase/phosphoribosyl-ATP diphosphatase HisIE [Polyangiaceae bacterium]|nr:bifunctional phosphoribosyl-AMP cyclohydrolase/phosphoribosyl-ATP diphosphatase HisIE [Polyangiaceae bacterium]